MRQGFAVILGGLTVAVLCAAQAMASDVVVKGPHICCPQCVNVAKKLLSKVEGVSDVAPDAKSKTVTFKATDEAAAKAGFQALVNGGFFGSATNDGKELKIDIQGVEAKKADAVTVKDVHVCCGACKKAINGIFKDAKVSYEGKGPQLTVRVEGANLDQGAVLEALRKGGFNGVVVK